MIETLAEQQIEEPDLEVEAILQDRFDPTRISELALKYLNEGPFGDVTAQASEKKYVMGLVDGQSEFADLGKVPETIRFSEEMKRPKSRVSLEYEPLDSKSIFLFKLDVTDLNAPKPVGSIRSTHGEHESDFKSITDFVGHNYSSPWRDELEELLFDPEEDYEPFKAWHRLLEQAGVVLEPKLTHDVATIAVLKEYGTKGDFGGHHMTLYHTCLRYALAQAKQNLISIQDVKPFATLQMAGRPFDTYKGVKPHEYGGPHLTIPNYCILPIGMQRIRDCGIPQVPERFIHGKYLSDDTLLLQYQDPDRYSDQSVGL